jgi:predicted negative regulator of RcsB-dependent stress response
MKSEERHKLQQNELADYLAKALEKTKPYQNAILGCVILLLAVYILYSIWSKGHNSRLADSSTQFHSALFDSMSSNEPSEFQEMAKTYADTPLGNLAALSAADMHLLNGSNQQFQNKAKANAEFSSATELYEKVLPHLANPLLIARAKFGLARVKECQNELPEAEKLYAEIVEKYPLGPYQTLASLRLEDLKRPATKATYDKFANFKPSAFKDETVPLDKSSLFDPNSLTLPEEGSVYTPGTFGEKAGIKTNDLQGEEALKDKQPADSNQSTSETPKPAEGDKQEAAPPASESPTSEKTPAPAENSK